MRRYEWLKGKELGDAMKSFKEKISDFKSYILDTPEEKIMLDFDEWLENNWKGNNEK